MHVGISDVDVYQENEGMEYSCGRYMLREFLLVDALEFPRISEEKMFVCVVGL